MSRAVPTSADVREGPGRSERRDGPVERPTRPVERPTRLVEPCLRCGHPVAVRLMGCKGGRCPNCRHPYPHGDCSD